MTIDAAPGRSGFLYRVESVRGLAAMCVAIAHTLGFLVVNQGAGRTLFEQPTADAVVLKIISALINGEAAVVVFFVISGLVIGRSLDGPSQGQGSASSAREFVPFVIRRVMRLYPAHIVAILGIIVLAALFLMGRPAIDFSAFPGTYPSFDIDAANWLNGTVFNPLKPKSVIGGLAMASWSMNLVVWSLYCEICAVPFLPLFHRLSRRRGVWIDAAVLATLIAVSLLTWQHLWSRYLFVFYLGMIVETRGLSWVGAIERLLGGPRTTLALLYVLLVLPGLYSSHRAAWVILLEASAAFGIISLVVSSENRPELRLLQRPALRWNGRLSYSFYLWHFIIMTIVVREIYLTFSAQEMSRYEVPIICAVALGTVAVALAVAQLSFTYIEMPSVKMGRALAGRWRKVVAVRMRSGPVHDTRP